MMCCAWKTGNIGYIVHNQVTKWQQLGKQTSNRPATFWPSIQRKGAKAQSRDRKRQDGMGIIAKGMQTTETPSL